MWKVSAPVLCLAALPMLGCAADMTSQQAAAVSPAPVAPSAPYYAASPRVYALGPAAPAAVLVFLPGGDVLAADSRLWEAQGSDVVAPQPADLYRWAAGQQAALARLVASARALEDAPIWLVGSSPVIDAALAAPQFGRGVSGVVVTSVTSNTGSCSESFFYSDPGTGAPPRTEVRRSGDCAAGSPGITERQPSILPAPRNKAPRIIEASAIGQNLPPAARVKHLAELIKAAPSG